jgi:hypothetical protein
MEKKKPTFKSIHDCFLFQGEQLFARFRRFRVPREEIRGGYRRLGRLRPWSQHTDVRPALTLQQCAKVIIVSFLFWINFVITYSRSRKS